MFFFKKFRKDFIDLSTQNARDEPRLGGAPAVDLNVSVRGANFGIRYRPDSIGDKGVLEQIFSQHHYEFDWLPQARLLRSYISKIGATGEAPLIVDAGANIGASTLWFSELFKSAEILAIEPDESNSELVKFNLHGRKVKLFKGALADRARKLYLTDPNLSHWGFRTMLTPPGMPVEAIGVKDILQYCLQSRLRLVILKIDIEGGEKLVFKNFRKWINAIPVIIIELHDWMLPSQSISASFRKAMSDRRWEIYTHGENLFCFNREILS